MDDDDDHFALDDFLSDGDDDFVSVADQFKRKTVKPVPSTRLKKDAFPLPDFNKRRNNKSRLNKAASAKSLREDFSASTLSSGFLSKDDALSFLEQEEQETIRVMKSLSKSNSAKAFSPVKKKESRNDKKSDKKGPVPKKRSVTTPAAKPAGLPKADSPRNTVSRAKTTVDDPDIDLFRDLDWTENEDELPVAKATRKRTTFTSTTSSRKSRNLSISTTLRPKPKKATTGISVKAVTTSTSKREPSESKWKKEKPLDTDFKPSTKSSSINEIRRAAAREDTRRPDHQANNQTKADLEKEKSRADKEARRADKQAERADDLANRLEDMMNRKRDSNSDLNQQLIEKDAELNKLKLEKRLLESKGHDQERQISQLDGRLQSTTEELKQTQRALEKKEEKYSASIYEQSNKAHELKKMHQQELQVLQNFQAESGYLRSIASQVENSLSHLEEIKREVTTKRNTADQERHEQILLREKLWRGKDERLEEERSMIQKMMLSVQDQAQRNKQESASLKAEQARTKALEDQLMSEFMSQNQSLTAQRKLLTDERREFDKKCTQKEKAIASALEEAELKKATFEKKSSDWEEEREAKRKRMYRETREFEVKKSTLMLDLEKFREARTQIDAERRKLDQDIQEFEGKMDAVVAMSEKVAAESQRIHVMYTEARDLKGKADGTQRSLHGLQEQLNEQQQVLARDREKLEKAQLDFLRDRKTYVADRDMVSNNSRNINYNYNPYHGNHSSTSLRQQEPKIGRPLRQSDASREVINELGVMHTTMHASARFAHMNTRDMRQRTQMENDRVLRSELQQLQETAASNRRYLDAALQSMPRILHKSSSRFQVVLGPAEAEIFHPAMHLGVGTIPDDEDKFEPRSLAKNLTSSSLSNLRPLSSMESQGSLLVEPTSRGS